MKIESIDGVVFTGVDASDICRQIWRGSFVFDKTFKDWMRISSYHANQWNGALVRTDTAENHLADLIEYKIYKLLEG